MEEIWRKVGDNYEISNFNGWRNIKWNRDYFGGIKNGYRRVSMGRGKQDRFYHILVAKAFPEICGKWFEGCQVHHKNFDKLDNRAENLVVLTSAEHQRLHYDNLPDSFKKGSAKRGKAISKALRGKKYPNRYKSILQFSKDNILIKKWESLQSIGIELGYSCGNISMCCQGKLKQAYGFLWRYACN